MPRLRAVPRFHFDETLASWIYRCAYSPHCQWITTLDLAEVEIISADIKINNRGGYDYVGFDFNHSLPPALRLGSACRLSGDWFERYFSPKGRPLLIPQYRTSFCPSCLKEDVERTGLPAWRKSWCYVHMPFCIRHKKLLFAFNEAYGCDCDKANIAYTQVAHDGLQTEFYRNGEMRNHAKRNFLAMRVQCWIESLYNVKNGSSNSAQVIKQASQINDTVLWLLKILLRAANSRCGPGFARQYYSLGNQKWESDYLNVKELEDIGLAKNNPYQRMIALLLTGYFFNLFSTAEMEWLYRDSRENNHRLPKTQWELLDMVFFQRWLPDPDKPVLRRRLSETALSKKNIQALLSGRKCPLGGSSLLKRIGIAP